MDTLSGFRMPSFNYQSRPWRSMLPDEKEVPALLDRHVRVLPRAMGYPWTGRVIEASSNGTVITFHAIDDLTREIRRGIIAEGDHGVRVMLMDRGL